MESSILICMFVCGFTSVISQTNVNLTTLNGPIIGLRWDPNPATNASYDAFIGIPYAQKPLRFQIAVPPLPWSDPLTTQQDGPACPQGEQAFDEDCLFLNVFTPVGASTASAKFPVIAYMHGAAFTYSSSTSKNFGPDFLVPANVILVAMNFRLGATGYLTLGSPAAPGNLGLHDSLLALQWIQNEIFAFGGDPQRVTLFGHSSGGAMTQYHYMSPLSTGLFRSAIANSGSALAKYAMVTMEEAVRRARQLATSVGCGSTPLNDTATVSCLQNVDINNIIRNQYFLLPSDDLVAGNFMRFVPVLDSHLTSDRPFFNDSLENLMAAALVRGKPMMTGFTTDDGTVQFKLEDWKNTEGNIGAFTRQSGEVRDSLAARIRERYFPASPDQNKVQQLVNVYTDYMFAYPAIQVARYFANLTYGFVFTYDGSWAKAPSYFSQYAMRGAYHGADLRYIFYWTNGTQTVEPCPANDANLNVKNRMVEWWTNFVINGVPDPSWPKVSEGFYRVIGTSVSSINSSVLESQYYDLWAEVDRAASSSPSLTNSVILIVSFFTLLSSCL